MEFVRYRDTHSFCCDVMDTLMADEAQNNLQIGIITDSKGLYSSKWLLAAIKDDDNTVLLTAVCAPPFDLLLYETDNRHCDAAVALLAGKLRAIEFEVPGVLAERGLAQRFSEFYAGTDCFHPSISMCLMRLDSVSDVKISSGNHRFLRENDLFFAPHWERAFSEECRVETFTIEENTERIKKRLTQYSHVFWEDCGIPVSQAVCGRKTKNGAVINSVYTPPHFRGRGYARSVTARLSQMLLDDGKSFCCLFADESNPISRGMYKNIGYYDICVFDRITFS